MDRHTVQYTDHQAQCAAVPFLLRTPPYFKDGTPIIYMYCVIVDAVICLILLVMELQSTINQKMATRQRIYDKWNF